MSALALFGGNKAKRKAFPVWPYYDEKEERALKEVLESRVWWRTPGTRTLEFERAFAAFHGARHGIAVTNGTAALEVTMAGLGITSGDEVIVPEIANSRGLALIEDSAHAHASEWRGQRIGTFGVAGTFSFQASKLITAGEGGMIISNDDNFEVQARSVHDSGRMPGQWFYSHYIYGSNYRLSEWQGAILNVQLSRLDEQTKRRHQNSRLLDRLLSEIPGITPQKLDERCTRNGQYAYIFHVNNKKFAKISTERFIAAMNAEGIPNQASYPPLHELDMFRSGEYRKRLSGKQAKQKHRFLKKKFPVTQKAAWETAWIPQPALLGDEEDMHEIAAGLAKIQKNAKELV